ncbi:MAG: hypothetical protein BMS9Abin39_0850 [Ignavibacteria bacterium]|nr:MAG: hypothetical protein BMS9Abin39_0850 [Ignavibacteria bacterium]
MNKFSYYRFLRKLCDGEYKQSELNHFIEKLFKFAESYLNYRYNSIKKLISPNNSTLEEAAIEAIAPLFASASNNNHFTLVDELRKWDPQIKSEEDSLFFLNKVIAKRVEQHIARMLRDADPFFSKILDSVNYLIHKQRAEKVNYLGKIYITEAGNSNISSNIISDEEFQIIPAKIFCGKKDLLSAIFEYLKNETSYFPAVPLNKFVIKLKQINLSSHTSSNSTNKIAAELEIREVVNAGLRYTEDRLRLSYLNTGKLSQDEYETFSAALRVMANDLENGGINPGLHKYLTPYFTELSIEDYHYKYHNILEYLLKLLKDKISEELSVK